MYRLCLLPHFHLEQAHIMGILRVVFLLPVIFLSACIFTDTPTPVDTPPPPTPTLDNQSSEFAALIDTPTAAPTPTPIDNDPGNGSTSGEVEAVPTRQVQPEELLPLIVWGGFGAGSDLVEHCGDSLLHVFPSGYMGNGDGYRYLDAQNTQIEMGQALRLEGCNYRNGEDVTVTFFLPDGTTQQTTIVAEMDAVNGYWTVDWFSLPGEPFGEYRVNIDSSSGAIEGSFFVLEPAAPLLTVYCIVEGGEGLAVMAGFQPQEEVLLAHYDPPDSSNVPNLADYQYVQMDSNGMALVDIPAINALFVAIGSERPRVVGSDIEEIFPEGETMAVSAYDYMFFPGKSCSQ